MSYLVLARKWRPQSFADIAGQGHISRTLQNAILSKRIGTTTNLLFNAEAGDVIESTCTFNNTTTSSVAFGQSTEQEMCYQFALAYPYDALNNGVLSLIGATNTCW